MNNALKSPKFIVLGSLLILAATAIAWQTKDHKKQTDTATSVYKKGDTTRPGKRSNDKDELRITGLDEAMKELDLQLKELGVHMKGLDIQLSKELNKALNKIDFDEINKEIELSLKDIDVEKINKEVLDELKKIDVDKIKLDVTNSLKEVQSELKKIDMGNVKQQMQELKQSMNSGKFKKQMDEAMKGAKEGIEKAKKELKELKQFTDELQADGLINKKKGYSLEWKNGGELYINGNKQPKEVSDKYRKYYKKDGYKINMNNEEDDEEGESM
ncbi:MAG: hypothetical protein ABI921_04610 [Panacibacter sp.]